MKQLILPLILLMALSVSQLSSNSTSPMRSIASVKSEKTDVKKEEKDEAPKNLIINTVGNDCVECRLAELQIQNLYQMMEMYAMNQVVLSQLSSPQYNPNAPSIMEQMGSYTDQLYATNPLVTGRINDYAMEQEASNHNSLSLSQSFQGYGFNYNSYLGNSESAQSITEPGFNFSAPPMDIEPAYRRMGQFGGFDFGGRTDFLPELPEVLITDSPDFYPTQFI